MTEALLHPRDLDEQLLPLLEAPRWQVGFSGGLDSTVLLHLLQRWCATHPDAPPLAAIHVNHALQAEADDWQLHCQWICRMLKVPLVCLRAEVEQGPSGLEAAAREARYRQFESQLGEGEVLLLGHHRDDQVETFFLRLLRGAGIRGLAAMPASRALGHALLARPLLAMPRSRLQQYAHAQGLAFIEDPSNTDTGLDRNYLRSEVLPRLEQRWPGYRRTIVRASNHLDSAAALLDRAFPAPPTVRSVLGDPGLSLASLTFPLPQEAALSLRHWLQAGGLPAPDAALLDEFLRQLRDAAPRARPKLECTAFSLQRYRDGVYLLPDAAAPPRGVVTLQPGTLREVSGVGRVSLQRGGNPGLLLAPDERLQLRWRAGGERCRPLGQDRSRSLKKLLQEAQVPPWWRERVPLFYLGDELLAVGDLWLCESSRASELPRPGFSLWQPRWERDISAAFD